MIESELPPAIPLFDPHPDWQLLRQLWPAVEELQRLGDKHGVDDIFQDNGGKLLQVALLTGLTLMRSREGNDATHNDGTEYEIKTVNLKKTKSFSTHHHLNHVILAKYRLVPWVFVPYSAIDLLAVYYMHPSALTPIYDSWKRRLDSGKAHLNNPKIPLAFVKENATLVYASDGFAIEAYVKGKRGRGKRIIIPDSAAGEVVT